MAKKLSDIDLNSKEESLRHEVQAHGTIGGHDISSQQRAKLFKLHKPGKTFLTSFLEELTNKKKDRILMQLLVMQVKKHMHLDKLLSQV